jgi:hypothetical protein
MKNNLLKYYIAAVYFCSTMILFAQAPGDNDTGGGLEGGDPAAPIDDYVWVLAVVGLFFVFMKFRAIYNTKIQG